ncbi:MAG: DUF364 domain-containing protein [Oscillospiraceae bacterium]|nr:DUF364 domain-containing protein [Oscillospiraceae bacterium]
MKRDFFALYDALIAEVKSGERIEYARLGDRWALAETASSSGIAMFTEGKSIAPMFPTLEGLPLDKAAEAVRSWNFEEASLGLAAANAFFNTRERIEALDALTTMDVYSTEGIDLHGLTVGIIGHMRGPAGLREQARAVYTLERAPQEGDYPDSACDLLLPRCDLVLITGSSLVNKTLPHLLELCEKATVILTGPSVPLCPALLDFGIDRIAGMAISDREALRARVEQNLRGSPYGEGVPFLLKRR